MLNEIREWTMWLAELGILWILIKEYQYDANKDEAKKQKRTRTTKKTTTSPSGEITTVEQTESIESKGNSHEETKETV